MGGALVHRVARIRGGPIRLIMRFLAGPGRAALVSPIRPEPVMQLQHCIGMSGDHARALVWCPGGREVVFVSNNTVIAQVRTAVGDGGGGGQSPISPDFSEPLLLLG